MARLSVEDVTKEFPTRGEPLVVLQGVSLALSDGDNVAIVGPSGSGKSTLLNVIGTLERPTSGRVLFDDEDPSRLKERELAAFRNRRIGFVFQDHHLLPQCSVLENVLVPTIAQDATTEETIDLARDLIERVGLTDRVEHRPAELSGGERQRVAIARALIQDPDLLLADEPTGNLDRDTATRVADLLLSLQQDSRMMMIVVTHSQAMAERMSRQYELDNGALAGGA